MHIAYIGLSYLPSQIGKIDLEKIAEQASKKHETHILVKNNWKQKIDETKDTTHIHRFHSCSENSLIDDVRYSIWIPFYCFFFIKKISVFHVYNPFFNAWICHLLLRVLFPRSTIIFDIRTWPLKEWIKKVMNYVLINLAHLTAHHTIIVSKNLLQHFFWVQKSKIHEISLWYTLPEKMPNHVQINAYKTFIYIGSIYPRRWISTLLEAFSFYFAHCPEDKLVIIWWWDETYVTHLKSRYDMKNFVFIGKVPHHMVSKHLYEADYGIAYIPQSSYFMDQPPLKTVEYLWHGLPVLATNTNGNKLFVQDTENWILTDDDTESTLQWIMLIKETFPEHNRQDISATVASYTRENIYKKIESVYSLHKIDFFAKNHFAG